MTEKKKGRPLTEAGPKRKVSMTIADRLMIRAMAYAERNDRSTSWVVNEAATIGMEVLEHQEEETHG